MTKRKNDCIPYFAPCSISNYAYYCCRREKKRLDAKSHFYFIFSYFNYYEPEWHLVRTLETSIIDQYLCPLVHVLAINTRANHFVKIIPGNLRLAHLARWIWIRRKRQRNTQKKDIPPRTEQSNKPTKKMSYLRQKNSEITALKIDVEYTHRVKIYMENKFCRWIHIAPYNVCGQFHFKFKLAIENFHLAVLCDNKYNPIYTILIKCKFKCVKRL